jgi:hypothetical protein
MKDLLRQFSFAATDIYFRGIQFSHFTFRNNMCATHTIKHFTAVIQNAAL